MCPPLHMNYAPTPRELNSTFQAQIKRMMIVSKTVKAVALILFIPPTFFLFDHFCVIYLFQMLFS